jgi:hypothetical protein
MSITKADRVIVVGKTGSGKTYLSRKLLAPVSNLVIIDSKGTLGEWAIKDDPIIRLQKRLGFRDEDGRIRYIPPAGTRAATRLWYHDLLQVAYNEGDCIVYIDELFAVAPPNTDPPPALTTLYTRGRERRAGVWSCTQRPTWIPLFALSESDHFFCFRLHLVEDRKRMSAFMGPAVLEVPPDKYGFWYYAPADMDEAVYVPDIERVDF